jgi:peptidoglycan biosynthesis protein MviN/MurJ (putative lipid II flippase)
MNYQARIIRNFLWIATLLLFAKIAGAGKEITIAWRLGTSGILDNYLFAFTIISWVPVIIVGILGIVIVPIMARIKTDAPQSQDLFKAELLGFLTVIGIGISFLVFLGTIFSPSDTLPAQTMEFLRYFAPLTLIIIWIGYFNTLMLAQERYLASLVEAIPAIAMIAFVLIFSEGWLMLIIGTLVGHILACIAVIKLAGRSGSSLSLRFSFSSQYWQIFWTGMGAMVVSQTLMNIVVLIDAFSLKQMSEGALATFGYATRVLSLFLTLGAVAISRAILPVMSQLSAEGHMGLAKKLAFRTAGAFFVLSAFGALVIWHLSPAIVRALFERGEFSAQDTRNVAETLQYGLTQLPFYFAGIVFVQYLASRSLYFWIAAGAALNLPVKYLANVYFSETLGPSGISLATGIMYIFSFLFLLLVSLRRTVA